MKYTFKLILVFYALIQFISCKCPECSTKCPELFNCTDSIPRSANFYNADLKIDTIEIIKPESGNIYTCRVKFSYINDDCAFNTKLVLLLPSNAEVVGSRTSENIESTSNISMILNTTIEHGYIEFTFDTICPLDPPNPQNFEVSVKVKSVIKNFTAFIYSKTEDANQCNNFKHLSE